MSDPIEISFGHPDSDHCTIRIMGYAYPDDPYTSQMFLRLQVNVDVEGFTARLENVIMTRELQRFYEDLKALHDTLRGTATFKTIEHWLEINVSAGKLGHISISGVLTHPIGGELENTLHFQLGAKDQTYSTEFLQPLKRAVDRFPEH